MDQRSSRGDRSRDPAVVSVSGHTGKMPEVAGSDVQSAVFAKQLDDRARFEAFLAEISRQYLNFDGTDLDGLIDQTLHNLGQLLGADRVGFLRIDSETNSLIPERLWYGVDIEHDLSVQYVDVSDQFCWLFQRVSAGEPVVIDRLDQFPDEAISERQYCESLGIRSFAMVPASLGGAAVAALSFDCLSGPRTWDDAVLRRARIVGDIIAGARERERTRQEIAGLHRFEKAVSTVSTTFVNLPPEAVGDKIEQGLGVVGKSLDADLASILLPTGNGGYTCAYEWCSEVLPGGRFKGSDVTQEFPWLADRLTHDEPIAIAKRSDFPAEAAAEIAAMKRAGHQAVLFVPFRVRGVPAGYLAVDAVEKRRWPEELVPRLRLLGEVFGEAISRREAELELQNSFREIKALKEQLAEENLHLREEIKLTHRYGDIVGESAALRAALKKVEQVAPTDSTVLICGETGTGKELIARAIHNNSARKDRLLVTVNCAALPSNLVEAELFGREKGAYTGALSRQAGRFEIADGSTILLDEVGELPLELQAKLLRVLQQGEFERLGSTKTQKVDVRVLASTNRDLAKAVEDKAFREDLYYRLNVFPIEVPPLRDRAEDIPQLVWAFVREFSESMGKIVESVSRETMEALQNYSWPGNVREVRNLIERAMIISPGPTLDVELPSGARAQDSSRRYSTRKLADVELEHIRSVVESTGWRIRGKGGAAEILGLKPTTLEARMKKLGLERNA
jgi:transcriptional regulator with GAF, ATPase, and Fis domain